MNVSTSPSLSCFSSAVLRVLRNTTCPGLVTCTSLVSAVNSSPRRNVKTAGLLERLFRVATIVEHAVHCPKLQCPFGQTPSWIQGIGGGVLSTALGLEARSTTRGRGD